MVGGAGRAQFVVGDREVLPFVGRLARTSMKCAAWVTGSKHDDCLPAEGPRAPPSGPAAIPEYRGSTPRRPLSSSSGRSRPEPQNTGGIFDRRQGVRIVGGDAPDARADGEDDLDPLVERRLVAGGAKRAVVDIVMDRLEVGCWRRARRRSPGRARSTTFRRGRGGRRGGRRRSSGRP